jgi:hypothetical protein
MTILHTWLPVDLREEYRARWGLIAAQLEEWLSGR